jgi:hypothetical protein
MPDAAGNIGQKFSRREYNFTYALDGVQVKTTSKIKRKEGIRNGEDRREK